METIKILAVDDVPANLMIIKSCLRRKDFELTTCFNALDALEEFKKNHFDVLLLDVIMPGIDGFELRKMIRELDKDRPIIFLTAMVDDGKMTMLNQIAWDPNTHYLNKVIDKEVLIQKINEVVEAYRLRQLDHQYSSKLETELKLAGNIQKILLPNWCTLTQDMIATALYQPAVQTSGDIFEIIHLEKSRYLLFVGDIAGHGISATLYMTAVLAFLKEKAREQDFSVDRLLNEINRFFCHELHCSTNMTAVAALIDFETRRLTVHNAGHPPLIICSPSQKKATRVSSSQSGAPLGQSENSYLASDNYELDFEDDTIFLAYTDGLLDTVNNEGSPMDMDEVLELLPELTAASGTPILPFQIKSAMEQMGYNVSPDSFTIVAVQKRCFGPGFLEKLLPADLDNAASVVAEFSSLANSPPQAAQIESCIHEYLKNAGVRGGNDSSKLQALDVIYLSIEKQDGSFLIRGIDRGPAWDFTKTAATEATENIPILPGYDMQTLQSITEHISYNHYCGWNEICFLLKGPSDEK